MKKLLNIDYLKNIIQKEDENDIKKLKNTTKKLRYDPHDRDVINSIDTPLFTINNKNLVNFLNPAAKNTFNINKNENIFYKFRRPEFRENINKFRNKKTKKKEEFQFEYIEGGSGKFYDVKLYKIIEKDQILLSFFDISHVQKLENLKSDFIGNVSHELKTPLSTIMNIVEIINTQKKISIKEKNSFFKILDKESQKMKSIIEDLLNLTKIETELSNKITKTINLSEIIRESISNRLKIAKKSNGINIKFEGPKVVNIHGDKNQIQQLSLNIIENSIKYANRNSILKVSIKNLDNKIILSFADRGKGIPHALIPRVTERFYRLPESKIANIEGTGLGLAIVKHIVLRHSAKLDIKSKINVGTTIEITFKKTFNKTRLDL